jgi:hypothetical protein
VAYVELNDKPSYICWRIVQLQRQRAVTHGVTIHCIFLRCSFTLFTLFNNPGPTKKSSLSLSCCSLACVKSISFWLERPTEANLTYCILNMFYQTLDTFGAYEAYHSICMAGKYTHCFLALLFLTWYYFGLTWVLLLSGFPVICIIRIHVFFVASVAWLIS